MCEVKSKLSQNVLYYGKEQELPLMIKLRAGPLSMLYEEGSLRCIKLGENEIVRAIYVAVRDQAWGTVIPEIHNIVMDIQEACFNIRFEVQNKADEIDFSWKGEISGSETGTLEFTMHGTAGSTFLKNRAGFCILHPIKECCGKKCIVENMDGNAQTGKFPENISPHQPFTNIRSISYETIDGAEVRLDYKGDIFEMEDQRNWTDASFKTYCTPLGIPYPVLIEQGTAVTQSVTLTVKGGKSYTAAEDIPLRFEIENYKTKLAIPRIGFSIASHNQPLSSREAELLKKVNPAHLRVDIEPSKPEYIPIFSNSIKESRKLGIPLEAVIHLSDGLDSDVSDFIGFLSQNRPEISSFLIFNKAGTVASPEEIKMLSSQLKEMYPLTPIGMGSNVYFAELNRNIRAFGDVDFLSYPVTPQVHAFDNRTLVENLSSQADTVKSIRNTTKASSIHISPVTLKPRRKINEMDERQMSLFGAAWTLGSLKYLAEAGVDSITYYETTGMTGIIEIEGCVFPMYHIFADIGEFYDGNVLPSISSDCLSVDGFVIEKEGIIRIILANMTGCSQEVFIDIPETTFTLRYLDAINCEYAMKYPFEYRRGSLQKVCLKETGLKLNIRPYGIVRIDVEGSQL